MNPLVENAAPAPARENRASRATGHALAMLALTLIGLYICFRMVAPFLSAIAWALALALLALPLQRKLERRIRWPSLAAALSISAVAIVVVVPILLISASLVDEAADAAGALQGQVESGEWRSRLAAQPQLARFAGWIEREFDLPATFRDAAGTLTSLAGRLVRGSLKQSVELLLTFYLLFYFLRDRDAVLQAIRQVSPLSAAQMDHLYARIDVTLHATLYGTFVVALVQGTLGGLMFWALGLPAPLLWGVVMGLLAVVPVLGAFLVWIPAALLLFLTGHPLQALVLTLWGSVVVGGIDNVLYPMLVGNRLHMHTVMAFFSLVGGLFVFGAAGLILGPLVLTTTVVLLQAWRHPESAATATGKA